MDTSDTQTSCSARFETQSFCESETYDQRTGFAVYLCASQQRQTRKAASSGPISQLNAKGHTITLARILKLAEILSLLFSFFPRLS